MTSIEQYTPRGISELDWIAAAKRTADAILRSNPLTGAVVSQGLMRWEGNHVDVNGDKVNFLWIGEFFPADTTMGGIPQRGIVMWRDDSTASAVNDGRIAFALYDHAPGVDGLGLRQTIHLGSLDGIQLYDESRHGGLNFPHANVPMYEGTGTTRTRWPSVTSTSFVTAFEGFVSCVGNDVYARYWLSTPIGSTAETRVTVGWTGGGIVGATHTQAANILGLVEDTVDVTGARGQGAIQIKIEARVASGAGPIELAPVSVRNYTVAG